MSTTTKHSCISDRPLTARDQDTLDINTYVEGLFDFILHAETPITIGVQGGWGSGKTSLINMLQTKLRECEEDGTVCVLVNAWEHSLLQTQGSKAEVTLSLLRGVLDDMKTAVKLAPNIPPSVKKQVVDDDGLFDKAMNAAVGLAKIGMRAAVMMGTGVDVLQRKDAPQETPSMAKVVRELRNNLTKAVGTIVDDRQSPKSPKRFVCFIDDLDRVPPETAVEILDVTKNIFDIPNCIFVLAVDYEVVVKGLEGKFGKKTEKNEREFRQYFDKIIQIPFTMPVGAYDRQMNNLLESCFSSLGYRFDGGAAGADMLENIRSATMAATDGIPRSVKRIVNTVSLLQRISSRKRERDEEERRLNDFEIRFLVVGLHINFPELCRRIMETPAFTGWKVAQQGERWELSAEGVDFNKLKDAFPESFDEDWEQVVYCLCQKNRWLKTRAVAVSTIMNCLRTALQRKRSSAKSNDLTEEETNLLSDVLSDIRVVSVEDIPAAPVDNSKVRTDQITAFCKKLHMALVGKIDGLAPFVEAKYHATGRGVKRDRKYSININNHFINSLYFEWTAEDEEFYITYEVHEPKKNKKQFIADLKKLCAKKDIEVDRYYCYKTFEDIKYEQFANEGTANYIERAVTLYHKVQDICHKLKN